MRVKPVLGILLALAAAGALLFFSARVSDEPAYTMFSAGAEGCGLLHDTLRRMGFPVAAGYKPVNPDAGVNDVYLLINPNNPAPNRETLLDMLTWVRKGGRLVYMAETPDRARIEGFFSADASQRGGTGSFSAYRVGMGEAIVGNASAITNQPLMEDGAAGQLIADKLAEWHAPHVYFAEYYHGYKGSDNLFAQLPAVVKLSVCQLALAALMYGWHKGKRLGRPVLYYEETERDENEYVKALSRLYYKTQKRGRGRVLDNGQDDNG